jgi:hypothetical protein
LFSAAMASGQESRKELDRKAREGETVVPGDKSLEAQEHLAEGTQQPQVPPAGSSSFISSRPGLRRQCADEINII